MSDSLDSASFQTNHHTPLQLCLQNEQNNKRFPTLVHNKYKPFSFFLSFFYFYKIETLKGHF